MKTSAKVEKIIFEQPLNDALRICLRLEHLFNEMEHYRRTSTTSNGRVAIQILLEILNVMERPDLKSRLTQSLMQHANALMHLKTSEHVDLNELNHVLGQLNDYITVLHGTRAKIGDRLRQNEFLNTVRMQMNHPGGVMDFNAPIYALWIQKTAEERHANISDWLSEFDLLRNIATLLLKLTRESVTVQKVKAHDGFYQQSLDSGASYQLIRVALPIEFNLYPEMSVGKHRMSIRFLKPDYQKGGRPQQCRDTLPFELFCCRI